MKHLILRVIVSQLLFIGVLIPTQTLQAHAEDSLLNTSTVLRMGSGNPNPSSGTIPTILNFTDNLQKNLAIIGSLDGSNSTQKVYILKNQTVATNEINLTEPGDISLTIDNIAGPGTNGSSFSAMSSAGDMNGDGKDELLVFAHVDPADGNSIYAHTQYAYMVWGGQTGTLHLDDFSDVNGVKFKASNLYNSTYLTPKNVGDISGDGLSDLAFGDFTKTAVNNPNQYDGQTHIVVGRTIWPAEIDLDQLVTPSGYQISGAFNSNSGWIATSAGDVNNDGIGDLAITDSFHNGYTSSVFVIFGGNQLESLSLGNLGTRGYKISSPSFPITTTSHVTALGDINNDGMDDMAISTSDRLVPPYGQQGMVRIVYGKVDSTAINMDSASFSGRTILLQQIDGVVTPLTIRKIGSSLIILTSLALPGQDQASYVIYELPVINLGSNQTLPNSSIPGFAVSTITQAGVAYFGDDLADGLIDGALFLSNSNARTGLIGALVPFTNAVYDTQAPTLGSRQWSQNPKPFATNANLVVPSNDNISGIQKAEYFVGENDPGQGNGVAMQLSNVTNGGLNADLTSTFGTEFTTGVYKISVRAQDNAGNWSALTSDYLVVYNNAGSKMTGKRTVVPSLTAGDILPGLIDNSQTDKAKFGFSVKYNSLGTIDNSSDFKFSYSTGTKCNNPTKAVNCHDMSLDATSISWLVTQGDNNSTGIFQGTATMVVDGQNSSVIYRVTGIDGERLSSTATDRFQLSIYAQGANLATDQPLWHINATDIIRGNIKISGIAIATPPPAS